MSDFKFKGPQKVKHIKTKYRTIKTMIPVPQSGKIFASLSKHEARSMHGQLPVVWDKAEDFIVSDKWGNRWIDFTSTIFVANSGHSNPKVLAALKKQISKKLLHTYTYAHEIRAKFLEKLIKMTPAFCQKAFLLSAGTEATECAMKLMRMHGQKTDPKKIGIVSFKGCMHGRTLGAEFLKGDPQTLGWIGYSDPYVYRLTFPYPWSVKSAKNPDLRKRFIEDMDKLKDEGVDFNKICGFMIESYQGWGAILYPVEYIQELSKFARKHNILVTFDEIQGGFGRSGKLFVYQHYNVEPDLICLGKALSGGLPLSAVIGRKDILDLPGVGSMSSTHSANPLCCAAGLANLEVIHSWNLVKESARKGKIMHARLNEIKAKFPNRINYILGKGLLAGVLIKHPKYGKPDGIFASRVCERAMQKGLLLVYTGRESIKIGPPLTITDSALLEGLKVLEESIQEIDYEFPAH